MTANRHDRAQIGWQGIAIKKAGSWPVIDRPYKNALPLVGPVYDRPIQQPVILVQDWPRFCNRSSIDFLFKAGAAGAVVGLPMIGRPSGG